MLMSTCLPAWDPDAGTHAAHLGEPALDDLEPLNYTCEKASPPPPATCRLYQ